MQTTSRHIQYWEIERETMDNDFFRKTDWKYDAQDEDGIYFVVDFFDSRVIFHDNGFLSDVVLQANTQPSISDYLCVRWKTTQHSTIQNIQIKTRRSKYTSNPSCTQHRPRCLFWFISDYFIWVKYSCAFATTSCCLPAAVIHLIASTTIYTYVL